MQMKKIIMVAVFCFSVWAFPAQATETMDLQTVLKIAYQQNPTIQAARANLKAVEENKGIAQAGLLPKLDANGSVIYTDTKQKRGVSGEIQFPSGGKVTSKSASLALEQPLFRGGSTLAEIRRSNELINAAKAALLDVEGQILFQTAEAYMNVLREGVLVTLNEKNKTLLARQLKAVRDRFDVGDVTRTDVSQAEFRLARADANLTAARGNLRVSGAVFEQLVGFAPKDLSFPKFEMDLPQTLDEAIETAERNNPNVHGAMFEHNAAIDQIGAVRGELLPKVSLQAGLDRVYDPQPGFFDTSREKAIGVVASVPLYEGGAVRARLRQAKQIANQRRIEITESERGAHQLAVSAFENLAAAQAEITSREAQVEAAEIARTGVRQEAEFGDRTILDALDADQEVLDAQTSLINAQRNEVVARFALAAAIGVLNGVNMPFLDEAASGDKAP